jgi:hypothetical protein
MSSRSLIWRRIGVGAVAVATVAAGSPLLLSTAANAAELARITITQENGRTTAAAGTCTAFEVTSTDAFGGPADAATITVTITESPASDNHDVDFCLIDDGTRFAAPPSYQNSPLSGAARRQYDAGPSLTDQPSESGTPPAGSARAANAAAPANDPDMAGSTPTDDNPTNNNLNGQDRADFPNDEGPIRFGVVGLRPGSAATINASFERESDDVVVRAVERRLTFTDGGDPTTSAGSFAISNAARQVELKPDESVAAKTSSTGAATHVFALQAFNSNGDVLGTLTTARIIATAGPNAPTSTSSGTFSGICALAGTGNEGEPVTCTYTATEVGTDTVTGFVNQTTGSPTFGLDPTEPRDTATATTTLPANTSVSAARNIVLTPDQATVPAGDARDFIATVTDAAGAPVNGVSVRFDENGPGAFRSPTSSSAATSTVLINTTGAGRAPVTFLTSTTDLGSNIIRATIATTGTQCTQSGGTCTDSSPVTITAAPSPSPSASASPSGSPSATPSATTSATPTASPGQTEAGSRYRGLSSPVRVLDTRDNRGIRRTGEIVLDLSNQITDANATAAVLNVTVTNGTRRGFLVAYPTGTTKPGTSNVNFEANQTQANEVVVRMSADKKVSLFVDSASAHVIADLVGSFTTSTGTGVGELTTNAPVRAFDSRNTATPTRRGEVVVDLTGRIPNGSTDAVLNVTVTRTSARGFVTVFPTGTARPGTSNVNFEPAQTQANEVITRVGTGSNANKVSFFVDSASAALIVDVVGAVSTTTDGQTFTALSSPQRALDTRDNSGSRRNGNLNLVLPASVPANATGVILNVTATNGTRPGFVTVFPAGSTNPGTSNVNFATNLTQANEVTTGLGPNNDVTLFVGGANAPAAHVIVDVVGYLTD